MGSKRYVLRCNPQTQARERACRADQWQRVRARIMTRNTKVEQQPRCELENSLRAAQALVKKYRLGGWVSLRLEGRQVVWTEDAAAREVEALLDGCYVVESELPVAAASTQQVHDRYVDLTRVERDFRTLKTGLLEIRPVFLRKAERTRGHALVCLGEPGLGLWRLADSYPAAQTEVLAVLSLRKANKRRLRNPRQGRPGQ